MNFLTLVNGLKTFVSKVDFIDFANSAFRIRLTGTATSDRTITLPNATGTVLLDTTTVPLAEPTTDTLRLGTGAAASNTTGYNWMAIGRNAGFSAISAYRWVAIGDSAGRSNTNARDWVAIGANAGRFSTTGLGWCAIGANAGYSNTIGDRWVALGPGAAYSSTTGSNWVAIGDYAGNANTIGSGWIAIGYNSATSSTTGSNFIAIGLGTLSNCTTGSSNVAIGHNTGGGITTGSGNTIIGANVTGLAAALTNNVILASGDGAIKFQVDSSGIATLPTSPVIGDNTTKVATTAFVQSAISEFPASFTAVVPLQSNKSYPTQTVTGPIAFTLSSATKSACARTTYRLIANGVNIPTFTGFTESSESIGYYNSNGILNIITFEWDGVTAWYRISQAKFAMPTTSIVGISFPTRSSSAVINGSNPAIYQSTDAEGVTWGSLMVSAQTIPAGKYGRITVGAHPLVLLGFNNSGALENFPSFEYSVYGSGTSAFTIGSAGGAPVNSGITISSTAERFYRLTRFSNGTVTAETSPDNVTWTLVTTFGTTNTGTLYVAASISGNQANRFMRIVSFELEL